MHVDCPLIFSREHHSIQIKLNKESEENSLKKFKVTLTGHYQKTISVYAETPEQVKEKTETILFDTDLIDFSDEDFIGGEAAITVDREDGLEESVEEETDEDDCCSVRAARTSVPFAENVCTRTSAKSDVLPSTEFGYPEIFWMPNSLVRGQPLIPRQRKGV